MTNFALTPALHYYAPRAADSAPRHIECDFAIYGATPGGLAAAITAQRLGLRAVAVEHSKHLGGVTASGLGETDFGDKAAVGGLSREFYRRLGAHYGQEEAWKFEPHVAEATFSAMMLEAGVEVFLNEPLTGVQMEGNRIASISTQSGATFAAPF